jgi:hypothetical protein
MLLRRYKMLQPFVASHFLDVFGPSHSLDGTIMLPIGSASYLKRHSSHFVKPQNPTNKLDG